MCCNVDNSSLLSDLACSTTCGNKLHKKTKIVNFRRRQDHSSNEVNTDVQQNSGSFICNRIPDSVNTLNGDSYLIITDKHSKNLTRISFAVLFTITISLAFHAPLPEASAAAGDITAVKTQSEGNSFEHDTDNSVKPSLVQVDSDTYALAYSNQQDDDGFISTFTISSDGTTITEVDRLEHETDYGSYNSLVQVDSDTYALAYAGPAFDGFISTFTISSDGTTITEVGSLEHDTDKGFWNSLVQVDSDTYALAYQGDGDDGFIATFTISSDGTTITEVDSLEHDTGKSSHNSLVQVDSDTYALAYAGTDDDGFISTFTIDSDGTITAVKTQSEGNNLEHDTDNGAHNSLVQVDSDTYALAYQGKFAIGDGGFISTFTISSDGTTITEVGSLEHDTVQALENSLVQVDSVTYALAYAGVASDGFISTFTISSDGTTITEVDSLEHDTDRGFYHSLVQVDSGTWAVAYAGLGASFISTFDIATSTPHQVGTVSPTSSAVLSWTAPTAGASDITDYIIQYSTDDSNWTTFDDGVSTATTATVIGLTGGTTYYFRVAAVNSSGTGTFSSSSSVTFVSTGGGGHGNCDSRAFGLNKSLQVNQVSYDIETFELAVQAYSSCGPIISKVFTSTGLGTLGLSMNQPLLDENIVIHSTYLEESDKKFRIVLENDRNSFDETFYIYDKSIIKTYKGYSHYTSEQQGTIYQEPEPTVEPTPEPGPIVELIVEPIVEPTPEPGPIVEPTPEPGPIVEPEPTPVSEPEPEQLPETDTSMWYWFVIAGILGIIFVIVYKQRQKNVKNAALN